jgi:hypothetical protein
MITADQILCHLIGDYVLQSDWMAAEKTKKSIAAACHALAYSVSFLFLRPSFTAMAFIVGTHFIVDRWRLARYVVWAKNFLSPRDTLEWVQVPSDETVSSPTGYVTTAKMNTYWRTWRECSATGYPPERPTWLTVWLLIIADNTLHLICNGIALKYF